MKVTKDTSLWDIHDYTYMKNVIITFKDGHKKKYFILDTTPAEDEPESGKDEIVYMTDHDKSPNGTDRYAGNGIPIEKISEIQVLDN